MSNSNKFTWKDLIGLIGVFSVIGCFAWAVAYFDDKSNQKNCEARYRTSACLMRMVEEVKAKEAYEKQIKELNK